VLDTDTMKTLKFAFVPDGVAVTFGALANFPVGNTWVI